MRPVPLAQRHEGGDGGGGGAVGNAMLSRMLACMLICRRGRRARSPARLLIQICHRHRRSTLQHFGLSIIKKCPSEGQWQVKITTTTTSDKLAYLNCVETSPMTYSSPTTERTGPRKEGFVWKVFHCPHVCLVLEFVRALLISRTDYYSSNATKRDPLTILL